jgi:hypothetical protein
VTVANERFERAAQLLELSDLRVQISDVSLRQSTDVRTCAPAVVPEAQQLLDFGDRETQVPCPANESQRVHVRLCVHPVAGRRRTSSALTKRFPGPYSREAAAYCSVSCIRTALTMPEIAVIAATIHMAPDNPTRSAAIPAISAPTA